MDNYIDLTPFRFWCQKVLPLVYDDSLSYYELLCKVIDYLNKTMEDVETLHGDVTNLHIAYEELQKYVNNYFNTLDVQEEINNKIDELINSGRLDLLLEEFVPYATPEMFGAKGDGITDDTKAINDAFSSEKPVYLSAKKYLVNNTISVTSNAYVQGCRGSIIYINDHTNTGEVLAIRGVENVIIDSVSFDCLTVQNPGQYNDNAIGITNSKNITIKNINVIKSLFKGITVQNNCENVLIENCFVSNCYNDGITVEYSTVKNVVINNCFCNYCNRGLFISGLTSENPIKNIKVVSCSINNSKSHGIYLWNCKDIEINANVENSNGNGVYIQNGENVNIECNIYSTTVYGVYINAGKNCYLSGYINESGARGITISDSDFIVIKNIKICNSPYAVYLIDSSTNIKLQNCDMSVANNVGIYGLYNNYTLNNCKLAKINNMPTGYSAIRNGSKDYPITPNSGFTHYSDVYGSDIIRVYDNGDLEIRASASGEINETNVIYTLPNEFKPKYYSIIQAIAIKDTLVNSEIVAAVVTSDGKVEPVQNLTGVTAIIFNGKFSKV